MHPEMLFAKLQPFDPGANELTAVLQTSAFATYAVLQVTVMRYISRETKYVQRAINRMDLHFYFKLILSW